MNTKQYTQENEFVNNLKVDRNRVRTNLKGSKMHYKKEKKITTKRRTHGITNERRVDYIKEQRKMQQVEIVKDQRAAFDESERIRR